MTDQLVMSEALDPGDVRALIDAAKAGNDEAFSALYTAYQPGIGRYIARRLRGRVSDWTRVEDLKQETFRRAFAAIGRYEHRGTDFGAWVVTIARNAVADYFKSSAYRTADWDTNIIHATAERVDGDPWINPEWRALHCDAAAVLKGALGRINEVQRECIELRFIRGLSVVETAAAMGRNVGAIKALQYRATLALARDPALRNLKDSR